MARLGRRRALDRLELRLLDGSPDWRPSIGERPNSAGLKPLELLAGAIVLERRLLGDVPGIRECLLSLPQ